MEPTHYAPLIVLIIIVGTLCPVREDMFVGNADGSAHREGESRHDGASPTASLPCRALGAGSPGHCSALSQPRLSVRGHLPASILRCSP